MHRSPASQRRRAKVRRRDQIRRRRAVALAVLVTLIVLAVWAAYAIPGQTPARVPQSAAMPTVDGSPAGAGDVVVAHGRGPRHRPAGRPRGHDGRGLSPGGQRRHRAVRARRRAPERWQSGPAARRHLRRRRRHPVLPHGRRRRRAFVLHRGAGHRRRAGFGRREPRGRQGHGHQASTASSVATPTWRSTSSSLATRRCCSCSRTSRAPRSQIGDVVARGDTVLGSVRGFPATLDQALSRYTSDTGDHVQMMVLRVTPELAGL